MITQVSCPNRILDFDSAVFMQNPQGPFRLRTSLFFFFFFSRTSLLSDSRAKTYHHPWAKEDEMENHPASRRKESPSSHSCWTQCGVWDFFIKGIGMGRTCGRENEK